MRKAERGCDLLPAMPNDGLGLPRQLPDSRDDSAMAVGRGAHLLCLPPTLLGGTPSREDIQALSQHLPHHRRPAHECRYAPLPRGLFF